MKRVQPTLNILLLFTTLALAVWYFSLRSQRIESLKSIAILKDEISLLQEKGRTQQTLARQAQESAMMLQERIEIERDSINLLMQNCNKR